MSDQHLDDHEIEKPSSETRQDAGSKDQATPSEAHADQDQDGRLNHSQYVRDLALTLFDQTRPLHDLGNDSRAVLELAATLHEEHIPQAKKKPYNAALAMVKSQASGELTEGDEQVLAAVLAYQQRKLKRKNISRLGLSPAQQRQAFTIAALLRIAVGLDNSRSQTTTIQQVEPARDEMWIVVDGPESLADAAAAHNKARLWTKIGYPAVNVVEAAEAATKLIPFPELMEAAGIQPQDPLAEAGRKVMRYHFAQMLEHEEGTRLGEDIEALHDMRVATRRLRAAFEVFADAFEPGVLKPHLKGLRATGRSLGQVRDLDVFMEKAQAYLATLPEEERQGMAPLLEAWQDKRQAARTEMLDYLDSPEYAAFKRKFNVFVATPGAGARQVPGREPFPNTVRELAPVLIYTRLASVRAFDPFLEDASIERLHALRIEFKKLRYTVEYFSEVLGKEAKGVINDLKKMQDHLGDLNDAQVAVQILRQFIDEWEPRQANLPIQDRQNIEAIVSYMAFRHAERHRLMETFPEAWKYFNRGEFRRDLARSISVL
jgi:CHAD domain-containing protein